MDLPIKTRENEDANESKPRADYLYWNTELQAAFRRLRDWHKQGDKIVCRYLDERRGGGGKARGSVFKLNMFNSNITTVASLLYGKPPRVDVSRNDFTGNDDAARVASEVMQRLLRVDVGDNTGSYDALFSSLLMDRLLPGLGVARVRYEVETNELIDPLTGEGVPELVSESAPLDYYYWSDVLWGWGRSFEDLPWIAFRSYLSKDDVLERFGEYTADNVQYKVQQTVNKDSAQDTDSNSAWEKAEIWEIWDKLTGNVYWLSLGHPEVLERRPDPLGLSKFFPCPPFLLANPTTTLYKPTPDYHFAQDLYSEIDALQTRISILTEAVKVVGVYDASADGIQRMFKEGVENDLIPVDNWALFAEKGGIQGQVDWVPIQEIANVLDRLRSLRDETIQLLQQVTGMSDVMRGNLDSPYEGVGQTKIKTQFGSSRIQALQEQFAQFASNLLQLKAEVVSLHFSPESIAKYSGARYFTEADQRLLPEAIRLIKEPEQLKLRVSIKPETMAQQDYMQLKEERASYLQGLSSFLQAAAPLAQQDRRSLPFLLEMLKWAMAGFKGSAQIEGVLDQAIEAMKQPQQQEQGGEGEAEGASEQAKIQGQIQLEQMRIQGKREEMQAKHAADIRMREADRVADIQTKQAEMQFDMEHLQAELQSDLNKISAKMEADVRSELLTSRINAEQANQVTQGEIEKEIVKGRIEIEKLRISKRADAGIKVLEKGMGQGGEPQSKEGG